MYKCPICKRHTLKDYIDMDTQEIYYMCDNKDCPDYGKQMTDIEIEE
ncbi:hypothetical protein IMZ78_02645 [Bacillus anthracis]|nr:hypothetical protein [Bacillus anthracis]MBE3641220.1 hypothetical protein [Bacillus anthracis]MDA2122454.1 hypothetical protein [Bacillus cereus]